MKTLRLSPLGIQDIRCPQKDCKGHGKYPVTMKERAEIKVSPLTVKVQCDCDHTVKVTFTR